MGASARQGSWVWGVRAPLGHMLGQGKGLCVDILLAADQDSSVPQSSKLKAPSVSVTGVTVPLLCVYLLPFCGLSVFPWTMWITCQPRPPSLPLFSCYVFLLPSSWCTLVMEQVHFQPVSLWPLCRISVLLFRTVHLAPSAEHVTHVRGEVPFRQLYASSRLICAAGPTVFRTPRSY